MLIRCALLSFGWTRCGRQALLSLLLLITCCSAIADDARELSWRRGELVASLTLIELPKAAIDAATAALGPEAAALIGQAQCDVRIQLILYKTRGPAGERVRASGAVLTPLAGASCPASAATPVLSYNHATRFARAQTMSSPGDEETQLLIAIYAAKGLTVVAPDGLGYYASTLLYHPYLHAESEADNTVDALRAARALLARRSMSMVSLVVTGYSAGGHAAMATHRALESRYQGEFPFEASAPMSAPLALEETFLFASFTPTLFATANGTFAIIAHNRVYRNIYKKPKEVFKPPYSKRIEAYFPGPLQLEQQLYAQNIVPVSLADLLWPSFIAQFQSQPNHPLRVDLRANSLLAWKPVAPTVLCGGKRDPVVPFFNTERAFGAFTGAPITVIEVDSVFGLPDFATEQDLINYHSRTVPPLCMVAVRKAIFQF